MIDPIADLADQRLYEQAIDLHVQLEKGTGTRPILYMLVRARQKAAAAMAQFSIADPDDHKAMRVIQQPIMLYDLMVESCREMIVRGKEADALIADKDRAEIFDLVTSPEDARALGIEPQGTDA